MANGNGSNGTLTRSALWLGWGLTAALTLLTLYNGTVGGAVEKEHQWNREEHTKIEKRLDKSHEELMTELRYIRGKLDRLTEQ